MDATRWEAARDRLLAGVPGPFSGWLASRADQLLRLPLSHLDPERGAAGVDARLYAVGARLADMTASGRGSTERAGAAGPRTAGRRRRVRTPRAPAPTGACPDPAARLASYVRAIDGLPGARPAQRPGRSREAAAVFAGTATAGWAAIQLAPALDVASVAGPVALGGATAAVTITAWRRRKAYRAALQEALRASDDALPRLSGHLVSDLDRQLREVLRRARAGGRLAPQATSLLTRIGEQLERAAGAGPDRGRRPRRGAPRAGEHHRLSAGHARSVPRAARSRCSCRRPHGRRRTGRPARWSGAGAGKSARAAQRAGARRPPPRPGRVPQVEVRHLLTTGRGSSFPPPDLQDWWYARPLRIVRDLSAVEPGLDHMASSPGCLKVMTCAERVEDLEGRPRQRRDPQGIQAAEEPAAFLTRHGRRARGRERGLRPRRGR